LRANVVDISPADGVLETLFLDVKALHVVRVPVDRREVHPCVLVYVTTNRGYNIGDVNKVLGLVPEPLHFSLP
jgi:hypothetical protein